MKFVCLFIFFFTLNLNLISQSPDSEKYKFAGAQLHYGFIIAHTPVVESISHTNPYGFDISYSTLKTSYESWNVFHCYNISGIQAGYFNFQNPDVTGSAYILSVFTEPVLSSDRRYQFTFKAGGGLSYMTRIYKYGTDTLNKFFSTRISFPIYLSARFKYRVAPGTFLTLSANFNHISNGSIRVPNYGMNYPTVSIGLEMFQKPIPDLSRKYDSEIKRKVTDKYFLLQALTGYKVVYSEPTGTIGVSARFMKQIRTFYGWNAGAEIIFDNGIKRMIEIENSKLDYKRFAVTGGFDFYLGRVIFTTYLGVYLYCPYKGKEPFYEKIELSYKIRPDILTGVFLKTHTSDAELFGFAVSYMLHL